MIYAFFYGAILTLGLVVPLGIQSIFLFNQGANQRHYLHALPSVITATLCDSFLIICAVLGISVAVFAIPWLKTAVLIIGFCFLVYMGWVTWHSQSFKIRVSQKPLSAKRQVMFAASVSLLNPHALLDTIGVIGTSSLQFIGFNKWVYTAACVLITAFWCFGLSVAGHFFLKVDKKGRWLQGFNKLSALIIWGVALYIGRLIVQCFVNIY